MKTRMLLMSLGLALGVAALSTTTNHAAISVADAQQASPIPSVGPSAMATVAPMASIKPMPMGSMKPMKKKKKPTTMPSPMASGMMMSPAPMKT